MDQTANLVLGQKSLEGLRHIQISVQGQLTHPIYMSKADIHRQLKAFLLSKAGLGGYMVYTLCLI